MQLYHLARRCSNVLVCEKVPENVRVEFANLLDKENGYMYPLDITTLMVKPHVCQLSKV